MSWKTIQSPIRSGVLPPRIRPDPAHPVRTQDQRPGAWETITGLPLVEYGTPPEDGKKAIRQLSINRAKGLDALPVIMVGAEPFQKIRKVDNQYTYFMGASRAKQMLAVVHG